MDQIASLLRKYVNGRCSPEELAHVEQILQSGHHQKLWKEVLDETALQYMVTPDQPTDQRPEHIFPRIKKAISQRATPKPMRSAKPYRRVLRIAAAVSLLVTSMLILRHWDSVGTSEPAVVWLQDSTHTHQRKGIRLADGTEVWLNASTHIRFPKQFLSDSREVYLSGEAFFIVTKDSSRPFIVHTQSLRTTVLGTSFNIASQAAKPGVVTVATGRVQVDRQDGRMDDNRPLALLTPNQQLTYDAKTASSEVHEVDASLVTAWKEKRIVLKNRRLDEAAVVLENYYNVSIRFEQEIIRSCLLTATFARDEPLEKILRTLNTILNVQYRRENSTIYLSGTSCAGGA